AAVMADAVGPDAGIARTATGLRRSGSRDQQAPAPRAGPSDRRAAGRRGPGPRLAHAGLAGRPAGRRAASAVAGAARRASGSPGRHRSAGLQLPERFRQRHPGESATGPGSVRPATRAALWNPVRFLPAGNSPNGVGAMSFPVLRRALAVSTLGYTLKRDSGREPP